MLSHNQFSYCKNNSVNMSDDNGFRPSYYIDSSQETDAMREASLATMNRAAQNSSMKSSATGGSKSSSAAMQSSIINSGASLADSVMSSPFKDTVVDVRKAKFIPKSTKNLMKGQGQVRFVIPEQSLPIAKVIGHTGTILATGYALYDDIFSSNSVGEAIGKIAYDGVFMLAAGAATATVPVVGPALGIGISVAGDALKPWIFED